MDVPTLSLCSRRTFLKRIGQTTATGVLLSSCATADPQIDMIAIANNLVYEADVAARTIALIKPLVTTSMIAEARIDQS